MKAQLVRMVNMINMLNIVATELRKPPKKDNQNRKKLPLRLYLNDGHQADQKRKKKA